jgi:hypothetical protein
VAVNRLKVRSCLIDGEAVAPDDNGVAVFARLRRKPSGRHVFLIAFDLLELDSEDLRREPFETRKARQLATRMPAGPTHQRAPAVSWRRCLPSHLQDGPGRHRLKEGGIALPLRPVADWLKFKKSGGPAVRR